MKYFIIYGHLEFLSALIRIFGFYFYHLKIIVIVCILYTAGYRQEWLANIYDQIIYYDKIILALIQSGANNLYIEYSKIKSEIVKVKKSSK